MAPDRPVVREWGSAGERPLVFWPGLNSWGDLQHGACSRATRTPGAFAAKPNVESHRLDAGHDVIEDAPEEVVRLVADWLRIL